MCHSIFLAQIIGCFLLVISLAALVYPHRWRKTMGEFLAAHPLLALSGNLNVILGLLLVLSHNVWVADWPVLITLIGWFVLLQGLMRVFFPDAFIKMAKDIMGKSASAAIYWIWLLIGVYLMWAGFSSTPAA